MFPNIGCFISDVYKKKPKKSQMFSEDNMHSLIYANLYAAINKSYFLFFFKIDRGLRS